MSLSFTIKKETLCALYVVVQYNMKLAASVMLSGITLAIEDL